MKFSILTFATVFAAFATAAPVAESDLVARQCSCHKVGNEWLCGGRLCPKDLVLEPSVVERDADLVARQCSCHKVGNEWLCGGRLCPKDFVIGSGAALTERDGQLEARQCSCHKEGNEWLCSGRLCP